MAEQVLINVDMDGVIAGFDDGVDELACLELGLEKPSFRHHFYSSENFPIAYKDRVRALSDRQGFFRSLPVIDASIEGLELLISEGYHPRILSSPISSNPYSKEEKLEWLEHHIAPKLGSFIVAEAVITKNKHLYGGAVLLDDRPEIRHADAASWRHVWFTQDYNVHLDGQPRVNSWRDPTLLDVVRTASTRND